MRLAKCLTQGARNGTISDEAMMNEFEVIEKLKGLASALESIGVTKELQSVWEEWDFVLGEAAGDRIEHKRSAQLDLAAMDFKRRQLYALSVRLPPPEALKGVYSERAPEYFHVCYHPCLCWIQVSQPYVDRLGPMRLSPWRTDGVLTKLSP